MFMAATSCPLDSLKCKFTPFDTGKTRGSAAGLICVNPVCRASGAGVGGRGGWQWGLSFRTYV